MRTPLLAHLGSAFAAATLATACTVASNPPPDQNVSQFCADWAKAICQLSTSSCDFTLDACMTYQTGQCTTSISAASTPPSGGPTRQYSQPNGKACIDLLNGAYGNNPTTVTAMQLAAIQTACNKVVVGNQASDQSCAGDNDCSGTLVCSAPPGGHGAVCAAVTQQNLGEICGDPGDQCQGDSYCAAQTSGYPKCVATAATGGACSPTIPCGTSDHCLSGTCQPRGGKHDPCTTNDDCDPASAPYCDTNYPEPVCTAGLSFAPGSYDCNGIAGVGTASDAGGGGAMQGDAGAGTPEAGSEAAVGD